MQWDKKERHGRRYEHGTFCFELRFANSLLDIPATIIPLQDPGYRAYLQGSLRLRKRDWSLYTSPYFVKVRLLALLCTPANVGLSFTKLFSTPRRHTIHISEYLQAIQPRPCQARSLFPTYHTDPRERVALFSHLRIVLFLLFHTYFSSFPPFLFPPLLVSHFLTSLAAGYIFFFCVRFPSLLVFTFFTSFITSSSSKAVQLPASPSQLHAISIPHILLSRDLSI